MIHVPRLTLAPDPVATEITRCALASLQASGALFYWIDQGTRMEEVSLEGISADFYQDYTAEMEPCDPSNVGRMSAAGLKLTQLRRADHPMPALAETYRQQLGRFDVTDVIDLMFWADGVPVAGVGVLKRRSDPAASGATLAAAGAMQRYMEFSLQTHSRLRRARRERVLGQTHGLTAREVAVSELVLQGLTNGEIAKALNMRLPTVKSHLMQVFGKTGCGNRTRLAAILNQLG